MKTQALLVAVATVSVALSGCTVPFLFDDADTTPAAIVKKALFQINNDNIDHGEELEDFLTVSMEYTHQGEAVPAASVEFTYTDIRGNEATSPMSDFSSKATLEDGDVVTVSPVNLTSGLVVVAAGDTLGQRGPLAVDWFTAEGAPIPIHTTVPGTAEYQLDANGDMDFLVMDVEMDETFYVERANAAWDLDSGGTVDFVTSTPAEGPRFETTLDLDSAMIFEVDADVVEDNESYNAGARATFESRLDALFTLQFNQDHELVRSGAGGSIWADGALHVWDKEHGRSEEWEPEDVEHPLVDEEEPYEEWEAGEAWMDAKLAEFLERLWSATIDVGDEYRFHALIEEDGDRFELDFTVQVTAREERTVDAGTFDTFRVSQGMLVSVETADAGNAEFEMAKFTHWVDVETHLPVAAQGGYSKSFNIDDFRRFARFAGDQEIPEPEDFSLAFRVDASIELQRYDGNLQTSPVWSLLGLAGPSTSGLAAIGFMMASDLGGEEVYAEEYYSWVDFSGDEEQDRLVVTSASHEADWDELTLTTGSGGIHFALNSEASLTSPAVAAGGSTDITPEYQPIMAGDYLDFCAELPAEFVMIEIRNAATHEYVGSHFFNSIQMC